MWSGNQTIPRFSPRMTHWGRGMSTPQHMLPGLELFNENILDIYFHVCFNYYLFVELIDKIRIKVGPSLLYFSPVIGNMWCILSLLWIVGSWIHRKIETKQYIRWSIQIFRMMWAEKLYKFSPLDQTQSLFLGYPSHPEEAALLPTETAAEKQPHHGIWTEFDGSGSGGWSHSGPDCDADHWWKGRAPRCP